MEVFHQNTNVQPRQDDLGRPVTPAEDHQLRLLSVLAHPDDESFGMGGTLALYAHEGVKVYLVCATRGEVGEVDAEHMQGYQSVADLREAELRCAAGKLGLAGVYFLDYRDAGMPGTPDNTHPQALAAAPLEQVAAKVAYYIRLLKPQVVLTFDPIGGYKHPDHIKCHNATVEAFRMSGDPNFQDDLPPYQPQKLYYHVMPRGLMRIGVRLLPIFGRDPHHFGRNGDIDLVELASESNFPIHSRIDFKKVRDCKEEAAACHASQIGGGPPRNSLMGHLLGFLGTQEMYMRAYPPPTPGTKEKDLFTGIR